MKMINDDLRVYKMVVYIFPFSPSWLLCCVLYCLRFLIMQSYLSCTYLSANNDVFILVTLFVRLSLADPFSLAYFSSSVLLSPSLESLVFRLPIYMRLSVIQLILLNKYSFSYSPLGLSTCCFRCWVKLNI